MKPLTSLLCLCFLLPSSSGITPSLWPLPSSIVSGESSLEISDAFTFVAVQKSSSTSSVLDRGIKRYTELIHRHDIKSQDHVKIKKAHNPTLSVIRSCEIIVKKMLSDEDAFIDLNSGHVEEDYELTINIDGSCSISSTTVFGALWAMETFSQLLTISASTESVQLASVAPLQISDTNRFSHRGFLIDSSRHFLDLQTILKIIDSLVMNKANVLHWHIVDAQSFSFDSPTEPSAILGAYKPSLTYTVADISSITKYANDRGVRVIIEVDVPGHAASWAKGFPVIMADCQEKYSNINNWALNPTLNQTYDIVSGIVGDLLKAQSLSMSSGAATGSSLIHLGGDEVVYGCFANDKNIVKWMNENGMGNDYNKLLGYFVEKIDELALKYGPKSVIHWDEIFSTVIQQAKITLPVESTIFQIWQNQSLVSDITRSGYRVIASPSEFWYLDHLNTLWQTVYSYDPTLNLTPSQMMLVLGGEVALWGELVDGSNFFSVAYPRASAGFERLWSPSHVTDTSQALSRLADHRCRMLARGIESAPVGPGFCDKRYI